MRAITAPRPKRGSKRNAIYVPMSSVAKATDAIPLRRRLLLTLAPTASTRSISNVSPKEAVKAERTAEPTAPISFPICLKCNKNVRLSPPRS